MSGIADPFNGHIDAFRISHVQRSDGWIETTWNDMSGPGALPWQGARSRKAESRLKPAKDKSTERIDGIVALIMAVGRAMVVQEEPQPEYQMFIL